MPLIDLPQGWQTQFMLRRLDPQISEHADGVALRRASNPPFYCGSCRLLRSAPADTGLAHWPAGFDTLIAAGRPEPAQVAIGITRPCSCNARTRTTGGARRERSRARPRPISPQPPQPTADRR